MAIHYEPLTSNNWQKLEALFGEKGACGGCWCMAWRLSAKQFDAQKGEANKNSLKALASQTPSPGILALQNDKAIGWIAIAPRQVYHRLHKSKILQPVDDMPVWSISCFFMDKAVRRQGLSVSLINEAAKYAGQQGATVIEAYPVDTSVASGSFVPVFNWTGVAKSFERAGFAEVARRSASRPIMRRFL